MVDQDTMKILGGLIEKIDRKLDDSIQVFRDEISNLKSGQTKLELKCESRGTCTGDLEKRIRDLEKTNERDEWRIFFKMTVKLATFILLMGSTTLFLYQLYEKIRNPAAPIPSMPNIP